jgi:cAMP-dependent protein kinase regulator
MALNTFSEPSPGFAQVMGLWNHLESLTDELPDIARMGVGKNKQGKKQFHMRESTMSRKKSLVKKPSKLDDPKMTSAQKWGQILTTSTQLMKAKRKIRSIQASRVKLHNIIAKKLIEIPSFTPPVHSKSDEDAQLIKDAIQCNFVFDKLSEDDLKPFIDAFELKHYMDGDIIIKQGDPGDYFYIVKSGEAMFYVEEEFVGTAPRGASFGDVALLYTCPQAATVKAVSDDTALFRVDQMCFRRISKARTEKIDKDKTGLLQAMECFKDVDKDDLKRLSEAMVAMVYKEGDILHDEDDKNPPFCVVQEGELMVTDVNIGATKYTVMKMGQGDFFGEESLDLTNHTFGKATAVTNGLAYSIDRATFKRVFGNLGRLVTKSLDKKKLVC